MGYSFLTGKSTPFASFSKLLDYSFNILFDIAYQNLMNLDPGTPQMLHFSGTTFSMLPQTGQR